MDEDEVLGYVDWKTARKDERGWFVERVLNRRSKYVQWLEQLIDAGLIGNSTEPVQKGIEKRNNGEIVKWPLKRDTLTVQPMEPRMITQNIVTAMKALHINLPEAETDMSSTNKGEAKTETTQEIAEMEKDEMKALLDEQKTALVDVVKAEAATAAKTAVDDALKALPEVQKGFARIEVTSDPADVPFKSIGDNLIAIANAAKGMVAPRIRGLKALEMKAALGSNEAIPSQGEFLLEPTLSPMFLKPIHEAGVFSRDVNRLPVGPNSNSGWIAGVDETSRIDGQRWGGVRSYHAAEAATLTASQPKFRKINWELHKAYVLQYATDELLQDAAMLTAIINQSSAEELDFLVNDDIFNGIGGDRPVGVMSSNALIGIGRYTANDVTHTDILNMWQRLHPRHKATAKWYVNSEVTPKLNQLTFTSGSTGILSPYVSYSNDGVMQIMGKPVVETEFNAALGTQGDIVLAAMDQYLFWERGSVEAASSVHIQFLNDQTAFRFIYRYDGQTALASAITPYKGSNTQSPFVSLLSTTA
jgi:HK97 family phage major capsid protein